MEHIRRRLILKDRCLNIEHYKETLTQDNHVKGNGLGELKIADDADSLGENRNSLPACGAGTGAIVGVSHENPALGPENDDIDNGSAPAGFKP